MSEEGSLSVEDDVQCLVPSSETSLVYSEESNSQECSTNLGIMDNNPIDGIDTSTHSNQVSISIVDSCPNDIGLCSDQPGIVERENDVYFSNDDCLNRQSRRTIGGKRHVARGRSRRQSRHDHNKRARANAGYALYR